MSLSLPMTCLAEKIDELARGLEECEMHANSGAAGGGVHWEFRTGGTSTHNLIQWHR